VRLSGTQQHRSVPTRIREAAMQLSGIAQFLHPLAWYWSVKYLVSIAGAVFILLMSYHYLVRSTFIGATLNGRRQ
jgi:hypothetical protein